MVRNLVDAATLSGIIELFDSELVGAVFRYGLLLVGGVASGVINTVAGGGSIVLVPILLAAGLPPSVANGTLRVSVLAQSATSAWTFQRRGVRSDRSLMWLGVPIIIGAGVGSFTATQVSDQALRVVFGALFVLLGLYLGFRRGAPLERSDGPPSGVQWKTVLGALAVGGYGGLIQAGVGFPLIALLVGSAGCSIVEANAVKVRFVAAYSAVALIIFALADLVAWTEGAVVAVGGFIGGWLGVRLQLKISARWLQRFIIAALLVSGLAMILRTFV